MDEFATWNYYITKFTNKKKKTLPSYGSCKWCTPCILQLLSQWIVCVPIHFIMKISCFWLLCVYQISREDKQNLLFQSIGKCWIFGEKTHYLVLEEGNEMNEWMNEWFEGPQDMGLTNSQQQQTTTTRGLLLFNCFALK